MNIKRMLVAGLALLGMASSAAASPFHGCTPLKPRLRPFSWGFTPNSCSNFRNQPLSCTKTKVIAGVPVTYPGDVVSGRLPAWYIEVTPHIGTSVFAKDPDGFALKPALKGAAAYYVKKTTMMPGMEALAAVPGALQGYQEYVSQNGRTQSAQSWHARTIKVPYAAVAWSFPSIMVASGSLFPTCFDGLSELSPAVWGDKLYHGETALTLAFAPAAELLCNLPTAGVMLPEPPDLVSSPWDNNELRQPCAFPTVTGAVMPLVWDPNSEAQKAITNPSKVCAGRLGPHLPRTGITTTDNEWEAVNTIAYRIATLADDHFSSGPGIEMYDRWQMVWPPQSPANPTAGRCMRPGAITPEVMAPQGLFMPTANIMSDAPIRPGGAPGLYFEGQSPVVFLVWRRFERCVEPFQGALFLTDAVALQPIREAACSVMNSADGIP